MSVSILPGDCLEILPTLAECSIDSCVTDPPYHLTSIVKRYGSKNAAPTHGVYKRHATGFMGKRWDGGDIAFRPDVWCEIIRILNPGAHLVAFGGTRTYHRMACAIEDAGFEIRDTLCWLYGQGFPKSHDIGKGIDKAAGAERKIVGRRPDWVVSDKWRQSEGKKDRPNSILNITEASTEDARRWNGWGTALKPAFEPIVLARKPLSEKTVAANVLRWGTGAINVDGCRVGTTKDVPASPKTVPASTYTVSMPGKDGTSGFNPNIGRWPANVVLSYPEDEYILSPDVTENQKRELYRWLSENP